MPARVIGHGTNVTYADLLGQLVGEEVLYACCERGPLTTPKEEIIKNEADFDFYVSMTEYHIYIGLEFQARTLAAA